MVRIEPGAQGFLRHNVNRILFLKTGISFKEYYEGLNVKLYLLYEDIFVIHYLMC